MNLIRLFSDVMNILNKAPKRYDMPMNPYYQIPNNNPNINLNPYQYGDFRSINNYYLNRIKNFLYKEI